MDYKHLVTIVALLSVLCANAHSKKLFFIDSQTSKSIPFVAVRYENTVNGTIADMDGLATLSDKESEHINWVMCSAVGYEGKKYAINKDIDTIKLTPTSLVLREAVVRTKDDRISRILDSVIAHKPAHNPDNYNEYSCGIYYKMILDVTPDHIDDTDVELKDFLTNQHAFFSETISTRLWKKPQKLQDIVHACRTSGFQKSIITGLITDFLPFHAYDNYIKLNGKDYQSPLSKGYNSKFNFELKEELTQNGDTIWIIRFAPNKGQGELLGGMLHINAKDYAVTSLIASVTDTVLHRTISIEQQYKKQTFEAGCRWFPYKLNYKLHFSVPSKKNVLHYDLVGNSNMDSIKWAWPEDIKLDKGHTVLLDNKADARDDSAWNRLRPIALNTKEASTYRVLDSIGEEHDFGLIFSYLSSLPLGKLSLGKVDLLLKRIIATNSFENYRLGLGLQTNDQLMKTLSIGAWAGYGFKDVHWKYGVFMEWHPKYSKDFLLQLAHNDHIQDPGRLRLHSDVDKAYLNDFFMNRADRVIEQRLSAKLKLGYWQVGMSMQNAQYYPLYKYALQLEQGRLLEQYKLQEVGLNLRYAYAERTAPFAGTYWPTSTGKPVYYAQVLMGNVSTPSLSIPYVQASAAMQYSHHIHRLGQARLMLKAGKIWSDEPLPLSRLFQANGYRPSNEAGFQNTLYSFGGMMTIAPNTYYGQEFINAYYRHDFDKVLFRAHSKSQMLSMAPHLALQYSVLYLPFADIAKHQYVALKSAEQPYQEAGAILERIVRIKYLNIYYITLNVGYFKQLKAGDNKGSLSIGMGIDL